MLSPLSPDEAQQIASNNAKEIGNLKDSSAKNEGQVIERLFMNAVTGEFTNEITHHRHTDPNWHIVHIVFDEGNVELKGIEHSQLSEQAQTIVQQTQQILNKSIEDEREAG